MRQPRLHIDIRTILVHTSARLHACTPAPLQSPVVSFPSPRCSSHATPPRPAEGKLPPRLPLRPGQAQQAQHSHERRDGHKRLQHAYSYFLSRRAHDTHHLVSLLHPRWSARRAATGLAAAHRDRPRWFKSRGVDIALTPHSLLRPEGYSC